MDDRYEIAKQHGMSIEFIDWFWENKKASLGSVWFITMSAMWEGWKGALGDPVGEIVEIPCDAELRSPGETYKYLQETFSDEGAYFKCKMLTIDGCSVYDDRPDVCKGYPTYNHNIEDFVNKQPDYNPYCNMWPVIKVVNI